MKFLTLFVLSLVFVGGVLSQPTQSRSNNEPTSLEYEDSSEEIEFTCGPGKGWHTRARRCVPFNCPGGPDKRDFHTGECLYSSQSQGRYRKPSQQWNDLSHVYRTDPRSTNFVRNSVLMRRG